MFESHYAGREDLDAAMKFGCGYPMGPLALMDLIGLDTAYEILEEMYRQSRNQRHAPAPILKQMITAGLLGRKTGRGFYTYAEPGSPEVVADGLTPPPPGRGRTPRCARSTGRRGRHRHDGHRHRRGVRQGRVRRRRARRAPRPRARAPSPAVRKSLEKAVVKGKLTEAARDETLGPHLHDRRVSTASPTCDIVVEAIAEDLEVKQAVFAALDEVCKPGDDPRDDDLVAAGRRVRRRDLAARGRHRHALLQPGRGDEARRDRQPDHDRARRSRRPCGRSARGSGRTRCSAATAPASSSTRCSSRTSTTRCRCSRRTTPPSTTSTRP